MAVLNSNHYIIYKIFLFEKCDHSIVTVPFNFYLVLPFQQSKYIKPFPRDWGTAENSIGFLDPLENLSDLLWNDYSKCWNLPEYTYVKNMPILCFTFSAVRFVNPPLSALSVLVLLQLAVTGLRLQNMVNSNRCNARDKPCIKKR